MRDFLAERLLAKIMNWTPEEISKERPLLQALASIKYNDYQQFSTGIRFIESLVRWLYQFSGADERKVAYAFIIEELIFISNEQMAYLVSISFNDKINPVLISKTANEKGLNENLVRKITESREYKSNLRKSLFIGLSDGSRMDYLRRSSGLNNEQVLTTHEIAPNDKGKEMIEELQKAETVGAKFNSIFLFDDFTASGISFFRPEMNKGKLWKFLNKIFQKEDWKDLIDKNNLEIHVIFYIATESALAFLQNVIDKWKVEQNIENIIRVYGVQKINNFIKEKIELNNALIELSEKYFDETVIDKHYRMGKCESPFLGFNEGALPLVLYHNTPNNSLPILWLPYDLKFEGLFPRVSRHKK